MSVDNDKILVFTGKISMEEFLKDEKLSKENLLDERERFQYDLDKNKDSVLEFDEFFHWVIPDNKFVITLILTVKSCSIELR